jgi:FixJ family two-component response regulator
MATGDMISIIDDDPSMRQMLVSLIRSLGYDARAFASGEGFLASDDFEVFTCVITDIHMPGMDGFELKQRLDDKCDGPLPVIMITARTEPDIEERAISSGAIGFLRKPFDGQVLATFIEKALAD